MHISRWVNPVNSLVFVSDSDGGEVPEWIRGAQVRSTNSCVAIACYPEQDGPTEIVLGDAMEIDPGYAPAFDDFIRTSDKAIVVSTVEQEAILRMSVPSYRTRVRVWVNRPRWADRVIIGVG